MLLRPLPRTDLPADGLPVRIDAPVAAPASWVLRAPSGAPTSWRVHAQAGGYAVGTTRRPPVVLVHGLIVASDMCRPLGERLAADGLVMAPDLPGCGLSDRPWPVPDIGELGAALATWCRTVVREPAVLVGVSMGSQVVTAATLHDPGAVAAAVLVAPTVDAERRSWSAQLPRWQAEQATQGWRLRAIQLRDYRRAGVPRAVRTFAAALRHRPEDDVTGLHVPTLVCWGGRDPMVRREWARQLADRAPQGHLAVLPGAVHAATAENPVELARVVNGFLDDLPGQPADRRHRPAAGGSP